MGDDAAKLESILGRLREVRVVLEEVDGKSNLTDGRGPTSLGHVVSAISQLERRKSLLRR